MSDEGPLAATRILVVDDDHYTRLLFERLLRGRPGRLHLAASAAEARRELAAHTFNLVLMDQRLPDGEGLELLRALRRERPRQIAILITGHADVRDAVRAVRDGLFDYITKPFQDLEELEATIDKALELDRAYREIDALRASIAQRPETPAFLGASAQTEALLERLRQVAPLDVTLLLEGESGTGKGLLARTAHALSERRDAPLLELNCGALPEALLESTLFGYQRGAFTGAVRTTPGYLERADGGTLFLDEIADMSPKLQSSLLQVLQDRRFTRIGATTARSSDFRLICATNRDLPAEVAAGRFREDLYYRLNVVPLRLPPLRERRADIVLLAVHFLQQFNDKFGKSVGPLAPEVIRALEQADWPGNVRQLEHTIERVVALHPGGPVGLADLDEVARTAGGLGAPPGHRFPTFLEGRDAFERDYLRRLLALTGGNVSEAARVSGIKRQNLYQHLKRLGIVIRE